MKSKALLVATVFFMATQACHAADHPIDQYQSKCIAKDSTTSGMTNCTNGAISRWDKELNSVYANLISSLAPSEQQALREAQRQWILYRDAEFKLIDEMYKTKDGTMYIPMRAADRLEIIKTRALQLQAYRDLQGL